MRTNRNIVMIDDDPDDRKLFFEAVRDVDSSITCVGINNGLDALSYLKDLRNTLPDVIFLDLRMPGLPGEECLKEIKNDPRLASIQVFIYSTSRNVEESSRLKQLGAVHFISKPVSVDDIYYLVSVALSEDWS